MTYSQVRAQERREPLHAVLAPMACAFFIVALITDILYLTTLWTQWETFSDWLILAGLILTLATVILLLIDFGLGHGRLRLAWLPFAAGAAIAVLSIFNGLVHTRDGYSAVAPWGVTLSAIVFVLVPVLGARHWSMTKAAP